MLHHLLVGTWTPPGALFTFEFDEEALTLKCIKTTNIPEDEPISWLTIDHAKRTLYGASMKKWSSHSISSPTAIAHQISHPMGGDPQASSPSTNTRSIFLLAALKPPYHVYCNPFYKHAGYGNVFSTSSSTGMLEKNIQNYEYAPNSGVHGMVFDRTETYLYSADMGANRIWCHKKDAATGTLELVGSVDAPDPDDHPRWVEMHPSGKYLYALMESGNNLAVYVIDQSTHMPVFTHITYPLIPPGMPKKMYRSDVVFLSSSATYLFATSRSNSFSVTGYMAAFRLSEVGAVERQICLNPTPTSGGHSNAVAPCPWSDEWLALTDDQDHGIEIYRWKDEFLGRVARCEVEGHKGFGMNAVWYD